MASLYQVTYPTMRLKLDRLIQKIKMVDSPTDDAYTSLIKRMALNEKIDFETAKLLILEYRKQKKEK